jgi:TetR/AcrR family transcriptional regulator, transcriptional repressor for nem operon
VRSPRPDLLVEHQRSLGCRGGLPAGVDPDDLALATLAALQGGLLLAQVQRDTRPLEVALDAMLDRIQALIQVQAVTPPAVPSQ